MEFEALKHVLKKTTKPEIPKLIEKWGFVDREVCESIDTKANKFVIINKIVKLCQVCYSSHNY